MMSPDDIVQTCLLILIVTLTATIVLVIVIGFVGMVVTSIAAAYCMWKDRQARKKKWNAQSGESK